MIPQISRGFFFIKTAKNLWGTVHMKYSMKKNESHIYEMEIKSHSITQGGFLKFWLTIFDQIRQQILGFERRPDLNGVILIILNEESCQKLMLSTQ
ncbi:unnamed protein product [Spirodela intermedia]|uniref:Uncharacterized protein n=1 Tax=Spirodela intermedia TaxID=51605 RepID=A0A7I8LAM9_SPIIN|nr:unnamed protein product [Spirodela intermedia]